MSCASSLYILYTGPLSEVLVENIFTHSVHCRFTFRMMFFEAQNLIKSNVSDFPLLLVLWCLTTLCQIQCHEDLPVCFLQEFYGFSSHI